jgi:hypothetical protein
MRSIRKRIQAQASVARANLDAAILGLRNTSLDQVMERLEQTRNRLERDGDMAWSLATRVLAKVKAVRESIQKAAPMPSTVVRKKAAPARKGRSTTNGRKAKASPTPRRAKARRANVKPARSARH